MVLTSRLTPSVRHSHVKFEIFNGGNMRTTFYILFFSLLFTATSWAADTFDMALPDQQQASPSSSGFVDSFQKDLGQTPSSSYSSSTSYQAPQAPVAEEPEVKGAYESAFSSYHSKKSSEDEQVDQNDAWKLGQQKPDGFDIDNMSYTSPEPQRKMPKQQAHVAKESAKRASPRAPASTVDEIPMPTDMNAEIDRTLAAAPESNDVTPSSVSAKDRKAMIMQTISDNYGELKSCYQDGLRKKSDMKGKVTMGWAMDPQGRVSGAEVQTSQLNNKQVEKCMVDRLSGWHFPRQARLQGSKDRMTYTFQFIPEKE